MHNFGLFVMAVYPGAFVELHSDQLSVITPIRQLRIYCAGVWHNFVLAMGAGLGLVLLPHLLLPFYRTGTGILVTSVSKVHNSSRA